MGNTFSGNHIELTMGITEIISQSEASRAKWEAGTVSRKMSHFWGEIHSVEITQNSLWESRKMNPEADLCSDKIYCAFHFCAFKTFFL